MKKLNLLLSISFLCSFSYSQTFVTPPLDPGVMIGGARTFNLNMQTGNHQFFSGINTQCSGYNQNYLGPTLEIDKGDSVVINVTNNLAWSAVTTSHWHGIHLPAEMDGGPHQSIAPGTTWTATWKMLNRASTYWYHPHPHTSGGLIDSLNTTSWQVNQGLAAMMIVRDTETDTLGLPSTYGVDEFPIILQDKRFNFDSTQFAAVPPGAGVPGGGTEATLRRGETILVNGVVTPDLITPSQMIRLRFLNASNARSYRVGFSDDRTFDVIGSDGGILDMAYATTRFDISPGERYEIIVDFTGDNGSVVDLMAYNSEIEPFDFGPIGIGNVYWNPLLQDNFDTLNFEIMTFNVGSTVGTPVTSYNTGLTQIDIIPEASANNFGSPREYELEPGTVGGFLINDLPFDPIRIDDTIIVGQTEIWDIYNNTKMAHPYHIHGNSFQVVSRTNGWRPSHPWELGWKDVIVVYSGETVRIIKQFEDYTNTSMAYMSHCHILEHEDLGMMTHWVVVDPPLTTGVIEQNKFNEFILYPNPTQENINIRLNIQKPGNYSISLLDINGRLIKNLVDEYLTTGINDFSIPIEKFPPGVYMCHLKSNHSSITKKVIIKQ